MQYAVKPGRPAENDRFFALPKPSKLSYATVGPDATAFPAPYLATGYVYAEGNPDEELEEV